MASRFFKRPAEPVDKFAACRDFSPQLRDIVNRVQGIIMCGPERIGALHEAVKYLVRADVPGAIIECGVWKGGSMMVAALTLLGLKERESSIFLTRSKE
jgi:O-methyltransferase